ncbi:DUF1565 domain-containing protein [Leifsonia sp. PS1209]|nr:DUF1565 domain-containing protein [Leifsonia sp. PS1209]
MIRQPAHRNETPKKNRRLGYGIAAGATVVAVAAFGLPALAATAAPLSYQVGQRIVADSLDRTQPNGWGAAQVGGSYSLSSSKSFSADGKTGVMALPRPGSSLTAALPAVSANDVTASTTIDVPRIPTSGNGVYAGLQLRLAAGSYYQANVRVGAGGNLTLTIVRVNGSTANQTTVAPEVRVATGLKPGASVQLEFQATGTNPVALSARAWQNGAAKPNWQATASDSSTQRIQRAGSLAAWSYLSGSTAAQNVAFDNLSASTLVPVTTTTPAPAPTKPPTTTPAPAPTTPAPAPTTPAKPVPPTTPTQPTQPTQPAPSADPSIDTTGMRVAAGAAAIGSTSYAVPANAVVVSPSGSDSAAGTVAAPFRTVQRALDVAPSGATIVLRGGTYHESVNVPSGKAITVQSYPKEAAWFDGSSVVGGWAKSGTTWVASGWNHVFDASPTYDRGASDGTAAGWQWLNPAYPMAAHPDQLFVGGVAQTQVSSRAAVKPGTFFYDTGAKALVMGSDPTGKEVRASDLQKAISVGSTGFTLKGVGVRRYAPSVPDMGTVTDYKGGATFENVSFLDNATTGVSVGGSGNTFRQVTAARNGLLGIHANNSDNLKLTGVLAANDNSEHFNTSPVSGGVKITRSRGVDVRSSAFLNNASHGLWFDESVYGMAVAGNDSLNNVGNGIVIEISATANLVDNVVSGNQKSGIKLNDVSNAQVWNNTISNNVRNLDITQDSRRGANASDAGHDQRQAFPDPTMTWITGPISISNNVISGGSGNCLLCVEDYSHQFSAAQMKITADHNLYRRPSANAPSWAVIWSRGAGDPAIYPTFSAFTAATGQDAHSVLQEGAASAAPTQLTGIAAALSSVPTGIPAALASLAGKPAGSVHLGAW